MSKRKRTVPQLTACTPQAVVAWIRAAQTQKELKADGHRSALQAACWWAAYRTVQSCAEDTTRHVAQAMQAGSLKPIRTLREIADSCLLDGDDEAQQLADLQADLAEFFLDIPREDDCDEEE